MMPCSTKIFFNICAPQDTLVRFALMATHTEEHVERGVQILKKIFVEQGII
jgi:8-amino-7-oxononanoate synthase